MIQAKLDISAAIREYLASITQSVEDVLGADLIGLYLCGSLVQNDFKDSKSDIDLLGVVTDTLDETERAELAYRLSHETQPVPAGGLEAVLFAKHAARQPVSDFPFEFAISTGPDWQTESEPRGIAGDMLINVALCRQAGQTLIGPPPDEAFAPVPLDLLRGALIEELRWHQREVAKSASDVAVTNAILNAARSLTAAETGQIVSKTEGVRCWLQDNPTDSLVKHALQSRDGEQAAPLDPGRASAFVEDVISRIESLHS